MGELWRLGARELSRKIATREISCVEVMRATLARIDAVNGAVNAIVSLRDREALMGEARVADAVGGSGWLHGIPVAVKDLVAVRGVRSTWGSRLLADNVPEVDDGLVRALRGAGAIVIGKTNVPEYGFGSHSSNAVFGVTRNPFDLTRTAGGSSGGAGAALATGMVSIADGSDMMGSLRNPASWNDVYGFRPTVGLVPGEPRDNVLLHRLATLGPMGRSVGDMRALLETMAGREIADVPAPEAPRIAWLGDWGGAYGMDEGLLEAGQATLERAAAMGWRIEAVAPPMRAEDLWESWTTLRSFVVAQELGRYWRDPKTRALLNAQAIWEIEQGLALSGDRVERAGAIRRDWLAALDGLFSRYDAIMLPAAQMWPFPAEWDWPRALAGQATDTYHRWMECVVPASLAGLPAMALPAGYGPGGLPHGLQLIGPAGLDAKLFAMGAQWEEMVGPRVVRDPA
ncbi:amidase [Gymnodinialimonas ceratoperidinii]|uniref:Amidase n=1 Tax=Gymnodinialimonas ceratoperidinii TaxID=2856823 RepID=A0A8F6TVB2_9RHOB|nr:amidase [Gymnodinialimonas ceratoperidinii]QXT38549.1 amidase [Gymnodinialimonas ceratoperidinii]